MSKMNYLQSSSYWQDLAAATKVLFNQGFTETEIINEILLTIGECENITEEELDNG
jgi:hypothetical protein